MLQFVRFTSIPLCDTINKNLSVWFAPLLLSPDLPSLSRQRGRRRRRADERTGAACRAKSGVPMPCHAIYPCLLQFSLRRAAAHVRTYEWMGYRSRSFATALLASSGARDRAEPYCTVSGHNIGQCGMYFPVYLTCYVACHIVRKIGAVRWCILCSSGVDGVDIPEQFNQQHTGQINVMFSSLSISLCCVFLLPTCHFVFVFDRRWCYSTHRTSQYQVGLLALSFHLFLIRICSQ